MLSISEDPVGHFVGLASGYLAESRLADDSHTVTVTDAHNEAAAAVSDTLAVAGALRDKLATLEATKIHQTNDGYNTLRRAAIDEAKSLANSAQRRYVSASEATERELLDSALPALASDSRESLARQELTVCLGGAKGGDASLRIIGIAKSGSPEVQAVLGTPYARTVLIAAGVADVDRVLRDARKVVASLGTTPEALRAKSGLDAVGKLGGGMTAAQAAMRAALPQS